MFVPSCLVRTLMSDQGGGAQGPVMSVHLEERIKDRRYEEDKDLCI